MAQILVIEDNPTNLELMVYLLKAFSHTTLEARDGQTGLDVARHEKLDLILCDLQLPDIDGFKIANQIKNDLHLINIPLVAVTALAMVGDRDRVLAAGFDGYLAKPIVPETFVTQVETFLHLDHPSNPLPSYDLSPNSVLPLSRQVSILVVDDTPLNIELLRSILVPSGYSVYAASQVSEALVLVHQSPPDIIISDLRLPGKNGYDLLQVIKEDPQFSHIPVIIHSASAATAKDQAKAIHLGAIKFLQRPIEPQIILHEIEACLRKERDL